MQSWYRRRLRTDENIKRSDQNNARRSLNASRSDDCFFTVHCRRKSVVYNRRNRTADLNSGRNNQSSQQHVGKNSARNRFCRLCCRLHNRGLSPFNKSLQARFSVGLGLQHRNSYDTSTWICCCASHGLLLLATVVWYHIDDYTSYGNIVLNSIALSICHVPV